MSKLPIMLTDRAMQVVQKYASEIDDTSMRNLRVDIIGGADSGLAYDLLFDSIQPGDHIFEAHGVSIVIRPDCMIYLSGSTIDWIDGGNGSGFQILNPNEKQK